MACLDEEMIRLRDIATRWCENPSVSAELLVSREDGRAFWTVEVVNDDLPEEAIEGSASGSSESLAVALAECAAALEIRCWGLDPDTGVPS
jgi:hypothetical protein